MGKRELLLIVGFVVLGVIVYQATAPEGAGARTSSAIGRIIDEIRREVRGRPASAESTLTATHAVPDGIGELRVTLQNTPVTIIGEGRKDIGSELWIHSNGVDEAEAKALIARSVLTIEAAGPTMTVGLRYPPEGSQRGRLTLRVPSSMMVQFGPTNARVEVTGVAGLDLESARRETIVRNISGHLTAAFRGGEFTIENVGSLRLSSRGSNVRLQHVTGDATLEVIAGELRAGHLLGGVDLDANEAEITLEDLQKARGPMRLKVAEGVLRVRDLRTQARIDGRGTDIEVVLDQPVALAVFNSSDRIALTPPRGGYTLDAATEGEITIADPLKPSITVGPGTGENGKRATASVSGGGPTITLRNSRGEIRINARE